VSHFNRLTPCEQEALSLAMEECGEVVQIIGKIQRHGLHSHHPVTLAWNNDELAKEIGDVECAIKILIREGLVDRESINKAKKQKVKKFRKNRSLLHHIEPL